MLKNRERTYTRGLVEGLVSGWLIDGQLTYCPRSWAGKLLLLDAVEKIQIERTAGLLAFEGAETQSIC